MLWELFFDPVRALSYSRCRSVVLWFEKSYARIPEATGDAYGEGAKNVLRSEWWRAEAVPRTL
jgi:hypothetical protein